MVKKTVKVVSFLLVVLMCATLLVACDRGEKSLKFEQTTDNYRTYYQIFPYSFADSDGDGIGDINGIIAKLDYIADMNFDGIWLTPVHQSTTYHKYDVVDYKSIDTQFGTLEDYDRLVEECHSRGMTVLMDLVFNHTSKEHIWFKKCVAAHSRNQYSNEYYDYYNLNYNTGTAPEGWAKAATNWDYECQFWSGMPDLNLDAVLDDPDGYLASDLEEVMRFWLIDHKVDGFRLDATSQYFTSNSDKNKEFLTWLNDRAKAIKPDCYIVGEGSWGDVSENSKYQESGVDSFFMFEHGFAGDHSISMAARLGYADYLFKIDQQNKTTVKGGIPALFIANHDTGRAWGILQGASELENMKLGYAVMALCCGSTFWYYGDEVGMAVYKRASDKDFIDESRRQPMPWGDKYTCKPVAGSISAEDADKYPLGTVKKNLEDKDSLINYIARANALRRAFPVIARCYAEKIYWDGEGTVIIRKGEGKDAVYIVANLSHDYSDSITLSTKLDGTFKLVGTLSVDRTKMPTLSKGVLKIPAMTFAILQEA